MAWSLDKRYLIAHINGAMVTPLCVLLNGPIGQMKAEGEQLPAASASNLAVFQVRSTNASHQAALCSLLCNQTAVYISLSSPAAVAVISHVSAANQSIYRTMTSGTVLVVGGQVEIVTNKPSSDLPTTQPCADMPHNLEVEGDIRLVLDAGLCRVHVLSGRVYLDGLLWALVESADSKNAPPRKLPYPSHAQTVRENITKQFANVKHTEPIIRADEERMPRPSASFEQRLAAGLFVDSVVDLPTEPVVNESLLDLQTRKKQVNDTHLGKCVDARKVAKDNAFKVVPEDDRNYNTNEPTYRSNKDY